MLKDRQFSPQAMDVSSTALITAAVSRHQGAIGYGGIAYAEGARIIRLATHRDDPGVWPSLDQVAAGKYPLSRPLYYYLNPKLADPPVRDFVNWVRSPAGQKVVAFVGFFPAVVEAAPAVAAQVPDAPAEIQPLEISPATMADLGFAVNLSATDLPDRPDHVSIWLHFAQQGQAIERVRTLTLRIGSAMEAPLALDSARACRFTLLRASIKDTRVLLSEAAQGEPGPNYFIDLSTFIASPEASNN